MQIKIIEETPDVLTEYEKIPIAFEVKSRFRVEWREGGLDGIRLFEETVTPYLKDYDGYGEKPSVWTRQWNIENWGILSAFAGETRIGGAAVAWNSPEIHMLEGRTDLACLWDIRVEPEFRGKGIGQKLFESAIEWSRSRGCRVFKIETQNVNVPACRFYQKQGCELGAINRFAYSEDLSEIQFLWFKKI